MKTATLCFLLRGNEICLAMKKVRFGAGKYNGFGGKVGDKEEFKNESIEDALKREAKEEFSIELIDFDSLGKIDFVTPSNPDWNQTVHVFICKKWQGEPTESEEMKPEWFKLTEIPYDKMWDDDHYWLPKVLAGNKINAKFEFDENGKVERHKINIVK